MLTSSCWALVMNSSVHSCMAKSFKWSIASQIPSGQRAVSALYGWFVLFGIHLASAQTPVAPKVDGCRLSLWPSVIWWGSIKLVIVKGVLPSQLVKVLSFVHTSIASHSRSALVLVAFAESSVRRLKWQTDLDVQRSYAESSYGIERQHSCCICRSTAWGNGRSLSSDWSVVERRYWFWSRLCSSDSIWHRCLHDLDQVLCSIC